MLWENTLLYTWWGRRETFGAGRGTVPLAVYWEGTLFLAHLHSCTSTTLTALPMPSMWDFSPPHTTQLSVTPTGCPTICFNSDTNQRWHRRVPAPVPLQQVKGSVPWHYLPLWMLIVDSLDSYNFMSDEAAVWGALNTLPQIWAYARTAHRAQENSYVFVIHLLSHVWFFLTPWTVIYQVPWDSSSKKTEAGCHFLLQGIFLDQGIKPASPALAGEFFTTKPPGKP